jgi:hypothetical protein
MKTFFTMGLLLSGLFLIHVMGLPCRVEIIAASVLNFICGAMIGATKPKPTL